MGVNCLLETDVGVLVQVTKVRGTTGHLHSIVWYLFGAISEEEKNINLSVFLQNSVLSGDL